MPYKLHDADDDGTTRVTKASKCKCAIKKVRKITYKVVKCFQVFVAFPSLFHAILSPSSVRLSCTTTINGISTLTAHSHTHTHEHTHTNTTQRQQIHGVVYEMHID